MTIYLILPDEAILYKALLVFIFFRSMIDDLCNFHVLGLTIRIGLILLLSSNIQLFCIFFYHRQRLLAGTAGGTAISLDITDIVME